MLVCLTFLAATAPGISLADDPAAIATEKHEAILPAAATNSGLALEPEPTRMSEESSMWILRDRPSEQGPSSSSVGEEITIPRNAKQESSPLVKIPWYRNGVVSLAVVLVAIIGAGMLARRFLTRSQVAGADVMRVLSRTYLSPKQSVVLVQMGGRFAFLGVTPDRISTLRIVEDAEEAATLRSELRVKRLQASQTGFDELLTAEASRAGEHLEPVLASGPSRSTQMSKTRNELKGLLDTLRARYAGRAPQRGERVTSPRIG